MAATRVTTLPHTGAYTATGGKVLDSGHAFRLPGTASGWSRPRYPPGARLSPALLPFARPQAPYLRRRSPRGRPGSHGPSEPGAEELQGQGRLEAEAVGRIHRDQGGKGPWGVQGQATPGQSEKGSGGSCFRSVPGIPRVRPRHASYPSALHPFLSGGIPGCSGGSRQPDDASGQRNSHGHFIRVRLEDEIQSRPPRSP